MSEVVYTDAVGLRVSRGRIAHATFRICRTRNSEAIQTQGDMGRRKIDAGLSSRCARDIADEAAVFSDESSSCNRPADVLASRGAWTDETR
jgi:hypothetical protein